jgi:RNA polymerase sigma-70 factor (ECF subfamily)
MQTLFLGYRTGDRAAARQFFSQLLKILAHFFSGRINHPELIDDLVQATIIKIHANRDHYNQDARIGAWIVTIANRVLIDSWRKSRHAADLTFNIDDLNDSILFNVSESLNSQPIDSQLIERQELHRSLETLKPIDQSIVYLYSTQGFSAREVGVKIGMSESAIKVRVHRIHRTLRKMLGQHIEN